MPCPCRWCRENRSDTTVSTWAVAIVTCGFVACMAALFGIAAVMVGR